MFTNEEIDLLLKSARARQPLAEENNSEPQQKFDFLGTQNLSPAQLARLSELHGDFLAQLGRSLTALTGCDCQAHPAAVEQGTYKGFIDQLQECIAYQLLQVDSSEGKIFLLVDAAMALPLIDLMLGGDTVGIEGTRPLTDVERGVLGPVIAAVGGELQRAWGTFAEMRLLAEPATNTTSLLEDTESVLFARWELQVGDLRGTWALILPTSIANAVGAEQEPAKTTAGQPPKDLHRLRERLMDSRFEVELFLPPSGVSVRQLAHLKKGQVIVLKPRSTDPIQFKVAGANLFQASPVSCGTHRGAQIKKALSIKRIESKETE